MLGNQKGMMGGEVTDDSLSEDLALAPHPAYRQFGQGGGISLPRNQGRQDRAGGCPTDIGDDRGQLDVGIFEYGLQPIGQPGPLFDQMRAIARQIAQLPLGGGWE